jgi:hypothetical protein
VKGRGLREERLEVDPPIELSLQAGPVVAGQPADDLVDLLVRALLALGPLDVHRVHRREGHCEDTSESALGAAFTTTRQKAGSFS